MYAKKMSIMTRVSSSRGSPVQKVPQAFFAHSGPLIRTAVQKSTPSSAPARATTSARMSPLSRYQTDPPRQIVKPRYAVMAQGTWK